MEVFEAIKTRVSIRKYDETRPVEAEKLQKVLEAARLAPSARNTQPWKFIVVKDAAKRSAISAATNSCRFLTEAPIILVGCGLVTTAMGNHQRNDSINLSIAMAFALLEATEQGLGTCWMASYDEAKVKAILHIPEEYSIVMITPLGYPAEAPEPKPRKEAGEIISVDAF